ncbi:hypothetical protein V6N11_035296 [Hibiscus sabdariffa]|uniref:Uncharacterized protein n=1 Tax=Hibiscus sabdariffa TaxID=183260 RepID=A0ABR2QZY6_9ROSI
MNHSGRIDEPSKVEVGSKIQEVYVKELGFKDSTVDPLIQAAQKKKVGHGGWGNLEHTEGKSKSQVRVEVLNGLALEEKLPSGVGNKDTHSEAVVANGKVQRLDGENKLRSWAEVLLGSISKQPELKNGSNSGEGISPKVVNQKVNEDIIIVA